MVHLTSGCCQLQFGRIIARRLHSASRSVTVGAAVPQDRFLVGSPVCRLSHHGNPLSAKQGYPLAVAILAFIALAISCSGAEPGRTSIFVRAPTGTTELVAAQPSTPPKPTLATPIQVLDSSPSSAIPVPTVTPIQPSPLLVTEACLFRRLRQRSNQPPR